MILKRRLPMSWVERVPLLWLFVADTISLAVALAVVAGWLVTLCSREVTMRWEATGIVRPELRRSYRLDLPALWP